jgi:hypothetical protein
VHRGPADDARLLAGGRAAAPRLQRVFAVHDDDVAQAQVGAGHQHDAHQGAVGEPQLEAPGEGPALLAAAQVHEAVRERPAARAPTGTSA